MAQIKISNFLAILEMHKHSNILNGDKSAINNFAIANCQQ